MSGQRNPQEENLNIHIFVNEKGNLETDYSIATEGNSKFSDDKLVYITDFVLNLKEAIFKEIHPILGKFALATGTIVSIPVNYIVNYNKALNENGGDKTKAHQEASLRVTGDIAIFEGGFAAGTAAGTKATSLMPPLHPAKVIIPISTGLIGGFGALLAYNEYKINEKQSLSDIFIRAALKERPKEEEQQDWSEIKIEFDKDNQQSAKDNGDFSEFKKPGTSFKDSPFTDFNSNPPSSPSSEAPSGNEKPSNNKGSYVDKGYANNEEPLKEEKSSGYESSSKEKTDSADSSAGSSNNGGSSNWWYPWPTPSPAPSMPGFSSSNWRDWGFSSETNKKKE